MKTSLVIFIVAIATVGASAQVSAAGAIKTVRNKLNAANKPNVERQNEALRQQNVPAEAAKNQNSADTKTPDGDVPEAEVEGRHSYVLHGKRDPFVSIIRTETGSTPCPTGKKCLVPSQIELKGIVRSAKGPIAVVENSQRKTYFLHVNDPVFNGHVVQIGQDEIVFRETVIDRLGRQSTRDIVRRIGKPAV